MGTIAAAGSGKTTYLVTEALKQKTGKVLITTFTEANEQEIKRKIIEINRFVPPNIVVQTWFSFLLQHGVRPFQGCIFDKRINGLILVSGQSGVKYTNNANKPVYFSEEKEFEGHFFSSSTKIYSDKLAKFVVRCNEKSSGAVVERLSKIFSHIFIDEVQDLAGYDLEFLKLMFSCRSELLLVGDPRQGTYSTNNASKNSQFRKSEIIYFFQDKSIEIDKDETSLIINHRCNQPICDLSNLLFPELVATKSGNDKITAHDGFFYVQEKDVLDYLKKYNPVQLRDSRKKVITNEFRILNFGESKGLTCERVLIYPTKPIMDWFLNHNSELAPTSKSKLYVAITRAQASVAVVFDYNEAQQYNKFQKYFGNTQI